MAVSWSSCWLMVTIWPSFIICLMTSEALTDILWARSATEMVSGTCTSTICGSLGGTKFDWLSPPRSPPRRPPRPPGAFQLLRALAPASVRPLPAGAPRFLSSLAQLEDSFSDLTDFLSPGLAAVLPGAAVAPGAPLGLWIVPLMPAASAGLASSGFLAVSTFLGAFIIARMAAASASAALRRAARSAAFCFSSASMSAALTTRTAGALGTSGAGAGAAGGAATTGASATGACSACSTGAASAEALSAALLRAPPRAPRWAAAVKAAASARPAA